MIPVMEGTDYITEDMFHDGIYNGLKYLQLI